VTSLLLSLSLAWAVACGRGARDDDATAKGPPTPWSAMGFEARKAYMQSSVLPRMTRVFQAYDAERFARVTCETCHGEGAEARRYTMPNARLFTLYPSGHDKQIALVRERPEILRFMFNRVVPEVQALLGAEPYDATTGTGLSCFTCHPRGE